METAAIAWKPCGDNHSQRGTEKRNNFGLVHFTPHNMHAEKVNVLPHKAS